MRKILKISGITLLVIAVIMIIIAIIGISYFFISTNDAKLDITKLDGNYSNIKILDNKNSEIPLKNNNYTTISEVSPFIINTFVSVEDKRFYDHKGIDFKRMVAALIKNIGSKRLKEGASTITQQLIKNTHLTNVKTMTRKLTEIRLAMMLEKELSKNEIMEKYLNNLYFGSGIYGIHDACKAFFDKEPSEVTLAEATILVGVVKNPAKNSPLTNIKGAKARQKVIFSVLKNNKTYPEDLLNNAQNSEIVIKNGLIHNKIYKTFINNAIFESTMLLNMDEKEIANRGYKIITYLDKELQENMYKEINSYDCNYNYVRASIDNDSMGVSSYISNLALTDNQIYRQVGSLIKPFSVYMPCYENNMINELTQIKDEPININGYSPTNFNNVYHGYVSVKDCVAHSYNIPAVKLLKELGLEKSLEFLSRFEINVDSKLQNLSLALGTNSMSPLKIASMYSAIANNGYYSNAKFVKMIIDSNGKIIYNHNSNKNQVVDEDINYQMLNNLFETVKSGTGSKLKNLPYQIACKTGTVANSNGYNTDAWCCAITSRNSFIAWDGANENEYLEKSHGGSGLPAMGIKDYTDFIYSNIKPTDFKMPNEIVKLKIDKDKLNNEHIVNAVPNEFNGNSVYGIFSKNNLPQMTTFEIDFTVRHSLFEDIIEFNGMTGCKYNLYFIENGEKVFIKSIICNGNMVRLVERKANIFKQYHYYIEYEKD